MTTINFNKNRISSIDDGTFDNISPEVDFLSFHQNHLTSFNPNAISDSVSISVLQISANLLNYLPHELLDKVRVKLIIFGNPFKCDCFNEINKLCLQRGIQIYVPTPYQFCVKSYVADCAATSWLPKACTPTVDKNVTFSVISYLKSMGYDRLRDKFGLQCAMFDDIE